MASDPDQQEKYIAIWSKAVDTQMHFNEMCVKSRQLGLTFVAAALGLAVVLIGRGADFYIPVELKFITIQLHISVVLIIGACLALAAVRHLDLNVYHKMLRGAVTFGEDFEENYMKTIFDLDKGMTQAISHFSRYENANKKLLENGRYEYTEGTKGTAEDKIIKFYRRTFQFLGLAAILLFLFTNSTVFVELYKELNSEDSAANQTNIEAK